MSNGAACHSRHRPSILYVYIYIYTDENQEKGRRVFNKMQCEKKFSIPINLKDFCGAVNGKKEID